MTDFGELVHLLRNASTGELVRALERDHFSLKRKTKTGSLIYWHQDSRIVVIHFHHSSDTLTRKTLKSFLEATRWTKEDLKRLKLAK